MPRTRLPTAVRREDIINASRRLFAERGYDGTSIEVIGRAVGLTGAAIYRHFKNKPAIFAATFAGADQIIEDALAVAADQPAEEALDTIIRAQATVAVKHSDSMLIWLRERGRMPPRARRQMADRRARLHESMERCLAEIRPDLDDQQSAEVRNILTSISLGAADQSSVLDEDRRIEFMVDTSWVLVREGSPTKRTPRKRSAATRPR